MAWTSVKERLPGPADSDAQQCVIVWHAYNGAMTMGWHQVEGNRYVTHWQPCPPPPAGTRAYERMEQERRDANGAQEARAGQAPGAR